jgi:hypothetical protein
MGLPSAATGQTGSMLTTIFRSRNARREDDRVQHIETIKAKLSEFGETEANPVKAEIATLRSLRDAGSLSESAYAAKVSVLLGTLETRIEFPRERVAQVTADALRGRGPAHARPGT